MVSARQLPLPFPPRATYAAADFIAAPSNAAALAWLARPGDWPFGRLVLCGPSGSGKTHLLHLWCAQEQGILWSAQDVRGVPVLPASGPVAVDDADLADEEALFHLINAAQTARRALLLAGREAPSRWRTRLPDLASRLRASTAVAIGPAEDALLAPLLARLLADRQLDVPMALQAWLLIRLPRHPAALAEDVARLDRAALARGQGVSRALAAAVVNDMAGEAGGPEAGEPEAGEPEAGGPEDEILMHASPPAPAFL